MKFVYTMDSIQPADEEATVEFSKMVEGDLLRLEKCERSLAQNDLIYALYGDISKQTGELLIEVRRECKLRFGVPILRAYDPCFKSFYDGGIKQSLTYEQKLLAMDFLPVTSLMKKDQATEYINTVLREYTSRGVRFEEQNAA